MNAKGTTLFPSTAPSTTLIGFPPRQGRIQIRCTHGKIDGVRTHSHTMNIPIKYPDICREKCFPQI